MSPEPELNPRLFPDLTAPPGGLARLKLRLRPRPRTRWIPALATSLALALVAVLAWTIRERPEADAFTHLNNPAAVRLGLSPEPKNVVSFRTADGRLQTALEQPSSADEVTIYWVAPDAL